MSKLGPDSRKVVSDLSLKGQVPRYLVSNNPRPLENSEASDSRSRSGTGRKLGEKSDAIFKGTTPLILTPPNCLFLFILLLFFFIFAFALLSHDINKRDISNTVLFYVSIQISQFDSSCTIISFSYSTTHSSWSMLSRFSNHAAK